MTTIKSFKNGVKNKANFETNGLNKVSHDIGAIFGSAIKRIDNNNVDVVLTARNNAFEDGFLSRWKLSDYHGIDKFTYVMGRAFKKYLFRKKDEKVLESIDWNNQNTGFFYFTFMFISGILSQKNMVQSLIAIDKGKCAIKYSLGIVLSVFILMLTICNSVELIATFLGLAFPNYRNLFIESVHDILMISVFIFTYIYTKSIILSSIFSKRISH